MSKFTTFVAQNGRTLRSAFHYAPIEAALGFVVALGFSLAIGAEDEEIWELWARLSMGSALLLPLLLTCSLGAYTGRIPATVRWATSAILGVCAALYVSLVLDFDRHGTVWQWALLLATVWFGLLLAPIVSRRSDDDARAWFWTLNIRVIGRTSVVLLFTGALYLGLAAALASIDALFNVNLDDEAYGHLFGATFFALVPSLVVGGIAEMAEPVGSESAEVPRMARWVGAYVAAPLLLVYIAILYAYNLKVAFAIELPRNALSPLALGAAMVGLAGTLLVDPLHDAPEAPVSARVFRWFPLFFLPLIPVPIWAISLRVQQYGWTEFRYVRLIALLGTAAFCLHGVVRLLRRGRADARVIPLIFCVAAFVAAVGPLSANAVGKRSQTGRLLAALTQADLLDASGVLDTDRRLPPPAAGQSSREDATERRRLGGRIHGSARYLSRRFGDEHLARVLGLAPGLDGMTVLSEMGVEGLGWYSPLDEGEVTHIRGAVDTGVLVPGIPAGSQASLRAWGRRDVEGTAWTLIGTQLETALDVELGTLLVRRVGDDGQCRFELLESLRWLADEHERLGFDYRDTVTLDPTLVVIAASTRPCGHVVIGELNSEVEGYATDALSFDQTHIGFRWVVPE